MRSGLCLSVSGLTTTPAVPLCEHVNLMLNLACPDDWMATDIGRGRDGCNPSSLMGSSEILMENFGPTRTRYKVGIVDV